MIGRLWRDRRGVALIEFAYVLPLVLLLGLGGIETGHYVLSIMRANEVAQSVADNAGRVRYALDEANVNEIMIGGKLIGQGMEFAQYGRVILSDLEQRTTTTGTGGQGAITSTNPNGYRQWIRWQRCAGALNRASGYGGPINSSGAAVTDIGAVSPTDNDHGAVQNVSIIDGMGPTGKQISATSGTAVMVVELFYVYQPILPIYFFGSTTIHVTQAYNIRQRTDFSIYNANARTGTQRSDCRLFNATVPT